MEWRMRILYPFFCPPTALSGSSAEYECERRGRSKAGRRPAQGARSQRHRTYYMATATHHMATTTYHTAKEACCMATGACHSRRHRACQPRRIRLGCPPRPRIRGRRARRRRLRRRRRRRRRNLRPMQGVLVADPPPTPCTPPPTRPPCPLLMLTPPPPPPLTLLRS